jgi:aryl-alcohol dehydrogenase-like predicted oxidoreductase
MAEIDHSLKRLGLDYVDLYQIHRLDHETPMEEIMEALHDVVKSGKARYIGASVMWAWEFERLNQIAEKNGWTKFLSMQNQYNLIYREEEREMMQLLEEEKISMTPYNALAAGRVCRMWEDENSKRYKVDWGNGKKYDAFKEKDLPIIKRIKEVSEKLKVSMAQVALAWIFSKPVVAAPVVGCTKISQLEDVCNSLKVKLSEEDIKYLEELYQPHTVKGALRKGERPGPGPKK